MPNLKEKIMLLQLQGTIQNYEWGGIDFIPDLLNIKNDTKKTYAEYWLGMHPQSPSTLPEKNNIRLSNFLKEKNITLPFLLKILDVRKMLSIQVHPDKKQAERGYAEETQSNIPLNDRRRIFKDRNHKPEMMLALSDFYLLSGFRKPENLTRLFSDYPEFNVFSELFKNHNYEHLYHFVMKTPQNNIDEILYPLLKRLHSDFIKENITKTNPDFWAYTAWQQFCASKPESIDRGILSIYLLNLICLEKGATYFHKQGTLHAYLQGQCVEIMANSDNVLRGGLTGKHIDIEALLKHTDYTPTGILFPNKISTDEHLTYYESSVPDFLLTEIRIAPNNIYTLQTIDTEIFFMLEGTGKIYGNENKNKENFFKKGEAWIALPQSVCTIEAETPVIIIRGSRNYFYNLNPII